MAQVDYPAILEEAWRQHLAPRGPGAPTFISLFAGCGGSSLGYSMAGYRELLAVEWDDAAVMTFKLNFPDVPVYHDDIHKLTVKQCLKAISLQPDELDLLDGSPPCQGFSTAGKRRMGDLRNQLYNEFVRLLEGLRPRAFVMENVGGMVRGKMKLIFADCTRRLKAAGYLVSCRMLDAKWFGVPQVRKRLVWVGIREGLGVEPSHPPAEHSPPSVLEAIGHLPTGKPGGHEPQVIEAWHASRPGQALRGARCDIGSFQSSRLAPGCPSKAQIAQHRNWRWDVPRQLVALEMALLHSFPPGFHWTGGKGNTTAGIGNSVPPLFMRAVALHVAGLLAQADGHAHQAVSDPRRAE